MRISLFKALLKYFPNNGEVLPRPNESELNPKIYSVGVEAERLYRLGISHRESNRFEDALVCYDRAIALKPDLPKAYNNRGNVLRALDRLDQALASFDRAIELQPDLVQAHYNRGTVLRALNRLDKAVTSFDRVIELDPGHVDAYFIRGNVLYDLDRLNEALASLDRTVELKPDLVEAYEHRGTVLYDLVRLDEALASLDRAIELSPHLVKAYSNRGIVLKDLNRPDEALASLERAIELQPSLAEAHYNRGIVLKELVRPGEALESFDRAIEIKQDYAEAYNNRGCLLTDLVRLDDALASFDRAIELKKNFAEAHNNRGVGLIDLVRLEEAEESFRHALEIKSDYAAAHSNLLLCLNYPAHLSGLVVFAEHLRWAESQAIVNQRIAHQDCDRRPQRRLRIGYVSPDFRQHSVAYFLKPLLTEHDREMFEVFCYADVMRPDSMTARLQELADRWINTAKLSDEALTRQIVGDKIDILVDLAGHTGHNRLLVFARKPAPIQVTWLGYPHSTGLSAIDYRFVDSVTDPEGEADALASETLVRLEKGFLCYSPQADAPSPGAPPCLATGSITFGSFNNPAKLSSVTLTTWAELLDRLPGSRLLIKGKLFAEAACKAQFLAQLERYGMNVKQVTLLGWVQGQTNHLSLYDQVDIALDSFPYNGTTTTCEALWMGVPVITLRGDRHAARVGASLLTQVGLAELIADSVEVYVDIATTLANDASSLCELRRTLRARMEASPLREESSFARKIEATYRDIWHRYCGHMPLDRKPI